MKNFLLFLILLFFSFSFYTQSDKTIDSLKQLIENAPNDFTRVRKILKLSNKLRRNNVEDAKKYTKSVLELSETLKFQLGIADAYNPIWIVRENELIELSPDKMPVGKHDKDQISFSQNVLNLQKGEVIYTLTDGMPDQFGVPNGKNLCLKN